MDEPGIVTRNTQKKNGYGNATKIVLRKRNTSSKRKKLET
jgi:hypothetical protein